MSQESFSMIIRDASLIDVEELRSEVPATELKVVQPHPDDDSHNELATIVILTLTPIAITALTAWLLRTHAEEYIDYMVTVRGPDGTETTVHLKIKRRSSEAPKSQVIKQLSQALKLPEDAIVRATAG